MRAVNDTHLKYNDPQLGTILSITEVHSQRIYTFEAKAAWHSEYPSVVHPLSSKLHTKLLQNIYKLLSYRRLLSTIIIEVSRAAQTKNAPINTTKRKEKSIQERQLTRFKGRER
jgi:hypothetical protein